MADYKVVGNSQRTQGEKQMNKYDIRDRYCKWWVGKKCRPAGYMGEFKRVKDVIFISSFSGVYGSGLLVYEDGTEGVIMCGEAYKPRKKDVEVMDENENEKPNV